MDRITRKELKTDKFALEVEHSVEFLAGHRKQLVQYGGATLVLIVIVAGVLYYRREQRAVRQAELAHAIQVQEAPTGPAPPGAAISFPTQEAKTAEGIKVFSAILSKHSGSDEAAIAASYLGAIYADQGKLAEAEKYYKRVADEGDKNFRSMGKLSLAQIYFATGRVAEGEKLLRSVMENPTALVSKEAATFALARAIAPSKPAEARKLLEPLRTERPAVSQAAITALSELPSQ